MSTENSKTVYVKVKTVEEALGSSLVPAGDKLKNVKTGAEFDIATLKRNAGQVVAAKATGNGEYPVTINGVIYSEDLIHKVKAEVEIGEGQKLRVFEDGTFSGHGLTLSNEQAKQLLKVLGQGLSDER
jgi:hypothetical protein